MCYISVNKTEVEFDYYLSLAKIFDEGYPSIPHAPFETSSSPWPPSDDIPKQDDSTPEEYAKTDVLLGVEKIRSEILHEED